MKLVSLRECPELKDEFCKLKGNLSPEYTSKILELKFPVKSEAFLFEKESRYIGRILLQTSILDNETGHWGLFSISDKKEDQDELMRSWNLIEEWFKKQGVKKIIGPYLYTTFFPYRLRIDTNPEAFIWEPNQPHHDYEILKKLNFSVHETYFTNFINGYGVFEHKGTKELQEALNAGFRMRPLSKENLEEEIRIIYDLSMAGFTENYLFAPIPYELFRSIYASSFMNVDLSLSCIQHAQDGRPVGFNFTFMSDDQIVIKSVCVLPEFRGKGLLNAGIRYSMLKAMEIYPHVKKVATALIHEDNGPSKHVATQSKERTRHEYVLMKKDLT